MMEDNVLRMHNDESLEATRDWIRSVGKQFHRDVREGDDDESNDNELNASSLLESLLDVADGHVGYSILLCDVMCVLCDSKVTRRLWNQDALKILRSSRLLSRLVATALSVHPHKRRVRLWTSRLLRIVCEVIGDDARESVARMNFTDITTKEANAYMIDQDVLDAACRFLYSWIDGNDDRARRVRANGGFAFALRAFRTHTDCEKCQASSARVLRALCCDGERTNNEDEAIVEQAAASIERFASREHVVAARDIVELLTRLCETNGDQIKTSVVKLDALGMLEDALDRLAKKSGDTMGENDVALVSSVFRFFHVFAFRDRHRSSRLRDTNTVLRTLQWMRRCPTAGHLHESAMLVLLTLVEHTSHMNLVTADSAGDNVSTTTEWRPTSVTEFVQVILESMNRFRTPDRRALQKASCALLTTLCARDRDVHNATTALNVSRLVLDCMYAHVSSSPLPSDDNPSKEETDNNNDDDGDALRLTSNPDLASDLCRWYSALLVELVRGDDDTNDRTIRQGVLTVCWAYLDEFGTFQSPGLLSFGNNHIESDTSATNAGGGTSVSDKRLKRVVVRSQAMAVYESIFRLLYTLSYERRRRAVKEQMIVTVKNRSNIVDLAFRAMVTMRGQRRLEHHACRFLAGALCNCPASQVYTSRSALFTSIMFRCLSTQLSVTFKPNERNNASDELRTWYEGLAWVLAATTQMSVAIVNQERFASLGIVELVLSSRIFTQPAVATKRIHRHRARHEEAKSNEEVVDITTPAETCAQALDLLRTLVFRNQHNADRARRAKGVGLTLGVMSTHREDDGVQRRGTELLGILRGEC